MAHTPLKHVDRRSACRGEIRIWAHAYSSDALAQAVDALDDEPLGYRVNIFLARLCFRGIYFPMMGKLAWAKVVAQNRRTIFKLVKEAVFGRNVRRPRRPEGQVSYEEAATPETHSEVSA